MKPSEKTGISTENDLPFEFEWKALNYDSIYHFLVTNVNSLTPPPEKGYKFSKTIRMHLQSLVQLSGNFFEMVEQELENLDKTYKHNIDIIKSQVQNGSVISAAFLKDIFAFEKISSSNEHDRLSGLSFANPFLAQAYQLSFMRFESLKELKGIIVSQLTLSPFFLESSIHGIDKDMTELSSSIKSPKYMPSKDTFSVGSTQIERKVMISVQSHQDSWFSLFKCMTASNLEIKDFSFSLLTTYVILTVIASVDSTDSKLLLNLGDAARQTGATISFYYLDEVPLTSQPQTLRNPDLLINATLLNTLGLQSKMLHDWTCILEKYDVTVAKVTNLCQSNFGCIDYQISIPSSKDFEAFRAEVYQLSTFHSTDIALQPFDVFRRHKRLVVFDMDSTLIQQEVVDEIANVAGFKDQVSVITDMAMKGEIDFAGSLYRRVALLKGLPTTVFEQVKKVLTFTEGARKLCKALKKAGFRLAVLSGGFVPFVEYVKQELNLDYAFANQLGVTPDGLRLTGDVIGAVVDGERKAQLLQVIAQAENIPLNQVVAVGDGANDLWMLAKAGLGVAFNAKPKVQEMVRVQSIIGD